MDRKHDLYHIAWLLRQVLIPDLVPPIMEYADLCDEKVCSEATSRIIEQRNAPTTLLSTPTLSTNARLTHPVRSIDFTIVSKDQGWCGDPNAGSWTWFTAGVLRRDDDDDGGGVKEVTREREVVRNPIAHGKYTTHRIHWSAFSDDLAEAAWVQALQNGDRIAVRGWARFGGWQNFVSSVEVKVAVAVVTR